MEATKFVPWWGLRKKRDDSARKIDIGDAALSGPRLGTKRTWKVSSVLRLPCSADCTAIGSRVVRFLVTQPIYVRSSLSTLNEATDKTRRKAPRCVTLLRPFPFPSLIEFGIESWKFMDFCIFPQLVSVILIVSDVFGYLNFVSSWKFSRWDSFFMKWSLE